MLNMKRKSNLPKDLQAVVKDALDKNNLFSMALKNPEFIDEDKARRDCIFPLNEKGITEMKKVFYESMKIAGIDNKIIFATKYANDETGRLCIPEKNKPLDITQKEWDEWRMLYQKGYDQVRNVNPK